MKPLTLAFVLFATAGTVHAQEAEQQLEQPQPSTELVQPSQDWQISAEEYAELLDDCGQTDNHGLATDD